MYTNSLFTVPPPPPPNLYVIYATDTIKTLLTLPPSRRPSPYPHPTPCCLKNKYNNAIIRKL